MRPFREDDVVGYLKLKREEVAREIERLDNASFLASPRTELEVRYMCKLRKDPLCLRRDEMYIRDPEGVPLGREYGSPRALLGPDVRIQGTQLTLAVPFTGSRDLWDWQASQFTLADYPELCVRDGEIALTYRFADATADRSRLKADIDSDLGLLDEAIQWQRRDVEDHNRAAEGAVRGALERKEESATKALGVVKALDIPIRRTAEPPAFEVPAVRRESPVQKQVLLPVKYEPEWEMAEGEYLHILKIMRSMSMVIERCPRAFQGLREEDIRTHFLIQLNGHYEGGPTGETFNAEGKTDILVRAGDRNVFIAECKFWKGVTDFGRAIDQLLSYLTWRDSKCGLIVFNRRGNSTCVRASMHQTMEARPEHRKTKSFEPDGDAVYVFAKQSDPDRELTITTQLFDVPATPKDG